MITATYAWKMHNELIQYGIKNILHIRKRAEDEYAFACEC